MGLIMGQNYQTKLGKVRGLGSAKHGAAHWWALRLTAIALIPLGLWLVYLLSQLVGAPYDVARATLSQPQVVLPLLALLLITFHHGANGFAEVIEDYVHHEWAKRGLLALLKGACGLAVLASIYATLILGING